MMHCYILMHRQNMYGNSYLFTQVSIFPVIQSKLVNQLSLSFHNGALAMTTLIIFLKKSTFFIWFH